jgi:hypothetical protein
MGSINKIQFSAQHCVGCVALSARCSLSLYFIDFKTIHHHHHHHSCSAILHINVTFFLSQFWDDNITRLVLSLSLFPYLQILVTSGCHSLPSLRQLSICCLFVKVIFTTPSQVRRACTSIYLTSAALLSLDAPLRAPNATNRIIHSLETPVLVQEASLLPNDFHLKPQNLLTQI